MKATVIIEQGETKIILKAENEFEKDVIEKINDFKEDYDIQTSFKTKYEFQSHNDHRIEIDINQL